LAKKDGQPRMRICPTCNHRGYVNKKKMRKVGNKILSEDTVEVCPTCGGDGMVPA
jgi:DnaJ-class molecular chaperone